MEEVIMKLVFQKEEPKKDEEDKNEDNNILED